MRPQYNDEMLPRTPRARELRQTQTAYEAFLWQLVRILPLSLLLSATMLAQTPRLLVEAPAGLRAEAQQVETAAGSLALVNRLIGAPASEQPIRVILAAEDSPLARSVPRHISGFADGSQSVIVLFPARATTYPHDSLGELLRHELAHILIHRASGGYPLPRWFHEGLAVAVSGRWSFEDRARLTAGIIRSDALDLRTVESGFRGSAGEVHRSYALAHAFVRYLLDEFGPATAVSLLDRVAAGTPFPRAFVEATGRSLDGVEEEWLQSRRIWNRWIPFLTSSIALWIAITLLAIWTIRRKRKRDARIRESWALEEQMMEQSRDEDSRSHSDEWIH